MEWTDANQFAAANDGWHLKDTGRKRRRRLVSIGPRFGGDNTPKLHAHIVEQAAGGSPLHLKLLALLYATDTSYYLSIMRSVSANQTGKLAKTIISMARISGTTKGEP